MLRCYSVVGMLEAYANFFSSVCLSVCLSVSEYSAVRRHLVLTKNSVKSHSFLTVKGRNSKQPSLCSEKNII